MRAARALAACFLAAVFLVGLASAEGGVACGTSSSTAEDDVACDASGLRSGFRSEKVVSLKPKASLVPENKLSDISGIQETPDNVLPGIVSELTKGIDISSGDPLNLVQKQIFIWTYDMDFKMNWNGKLFAIPDQVSIFLKNVCNISEIRTSSMSTSFTESMTAQAESWSAGFDQKVDIGIEYRGVGIETQIQNTMMFGQSTVSREYESQFHQERTMSMNTASRAEAYNSQLYDEKIDDSWFHPWFKDAAIAFGQNPTKKMAYDMFDDYGTHFIQEAELGGEASRSVFFHSVIDKKAASSYFSEASESTMGWLWFKGSKSDSETTTTKSSDGKMGSVYSSATTIVGGDPSADSPGAFCASLEHYQTPRVLTFKKLVPIWDILDKITGVPPGSGKKMSKHVTRFWQEGEQCALSTCGAQVSMCSWRPKTRTWGVPCKCLSAAARAVDIPGYSVQMVEFERSDGVKAKFAGWTMFRGVGEYQQDSYEIDFKSDCFVWEDGKFGREKVEGGWKAYADKVTVTVNMPPHKTTVVCFHGDCSDSDPGEPFENTTDSIIKKTFTNKQLPWDDSGFMSKFWIEIYSWDHEDYKSYKSEL